MIKNISMLFYFKSTYHKRKSFFSFLFVIIILQTQTKGQQIDCYKELTKIGVDTTKVLLFENTDKQLLQIVTQAEKLKKFDRIRNRHFYIFNFVDKENKTFVEFSKVYTALPYFELLKDTATYYFGYTKKMGLVTLYTTKVKHNREEFCYKSLIEVLMFYNLPFKEQYKISNNDKLVNIKPATKKLYLIK